MEGEKLPIGIVPDKANLDSSRALIEVGVGHVVAGQTLMNDVLVLDEFGYLPADPEIGPILYEVIATRYEKKATIVTSNKSLTEWGRVLHDSAVAAALVDRLMHHGDVYYLKGESYRIRGKPRTESPEPPPAPEPVAENRDGSSGS